MTHLKAPDIYEILYCIYIYIYIYIYQRIREKTRAHNIVKEIKQYRKKWLQHVQRMDRNRLPRQALKYRPEEDGTLDDRRKDGGTNSTLRTKEEGTHLTLNEHDDDDDIYIYIYNFILFLHVSVTFAPSSSGLCHLLYLSNLQILVYNCRGGVSDAGTCRSDIRL